MKKLITTLAFAVLAYFNAMACTYSLELNDSWGDGWDGASMQVWVNGGLVNTYSPTASGLTISINVNTGDAIQLIYSAGSYENEHTWFLYDQNGSLLTSGGPNPATGTVYNNNSVDCGGSGGPATASDCSQAINICSDDGFEIDPAGNGSINEIPASGSFGNPSNNNPGGSGNSGCLQSGETNSTWMIINISQSGDLEFSFGGGGAQVGYYDWIMYPYNASSCSAIPANTVAPVRCNWNATSSGGTGCAAIVPSGGNAGNYEPALPVTCGQQYIICFSNWSSAVSSVPIDFFGTAGVACDDVNCAGNTPCVVGQGPTGPQDCINAIPVCQDYFCQDSYFSGTGAIPNEINSGPSCLGSGEKNDVWYTFSVLQTGNVSFTITPNNSNDDYDWAVYNLTDANCSDIYNNGALEVSCNFSANIGCNGITGPNGENVDCAGQNENVIPVVIGQTYVVNVSNFSTSQSGYELDFSASSAVIFDDLPPVLQSVNTVPTCGTTQLEFEFSELILCSSIANCDFTLTGPGGPYTLSGLSGQACALGGTQENLFTINVSPPMTAAGNYNFNLVATCGWVEDLCGNIATNATIPLVVAPLNVSITHLNATCNNVCNGTATLTVNGGTPNYTYYWAGSTTGFTDTNGPTPTSGDAIVALCDDTYTVTVVDVNGCTATTSTVVTEPAGMTLNLTPTDAVCGNPNGSISASVTGGASTYTYAILPSGTGASGQGTSYNFTGLNSNTYFVTVTDANGCPVTGSSTVGGTGTMVATFTYFSNQCYNAGGNSVSFTGTAPGATTFAWDFDGNGSTDNTTQNPTWNYTAPGVYNATFTASNGSCTDTEIIPVTIYNLPTLTFTPVPPTCDGFCDGQITVVPAAGGPAGSTVFNDYNWSNGITTAVNSGLCDGTYSVTVTDNFGCSVTGSSTITEPAVLGITPADVDPTCNGGFNGQAQVVAVTGGLGPFTYQWNTGGTGPNLTGIGAGSYSVTVTDGASIGCTVVQNYLLVNPPGIVLTPSSVNSNCNLSDGSATIAITNGTAPYTIDWTPDLGFGDGNLTFANIPSGSYTVLVTDLSGCTATVTIDVNDNSGPVATLSSSTDILCFGNCTGTMVVDIAGGTTPYDIDWDNGTTTYTASNAQETASSLCSGNHVFSVSDANNCISSVNVDILAPTALLAPVVGVNANCGTPGSATVFPTGGTPIYSFAWSSGGGGVTANNLSAGIYTVTVTDANLCSVVTSVTISDVGGLVATITGNTPVSCYNGSNGTATVSVTGGTANYTYNWSSGTNVTIPATSHTASGLSPGTYTVTVTDNNICSDIATVIIGNPTQVTATITNTTNASCNSYCNGDALVAGSGGNPGYTCLWDFGAGNQTSFTASNLCAGTYSVTVYDVNLCPATTTVTIFAPAIFVATSSSSTAHCGLSDGSAWVTSTTGGNAGIYTYAWACTVSTDDSVSGIPPGPCTVTVTDILGCQATATTTVPNAPAGSATITNIVNVNCNGNANGSAAVSYSGTAQSYLWSNSQITQSATGLSGGTYYVTVTDIFGCTDNDSVTIAEPQPLVLTINTSEPFCNGGNNGSVEASITGGTAPYTYQWSNGLTIPNPNVPAGFYCATVTDFKGCSISACNTVTQPAALALSDSIIHASCNQADGAVYLTATGGTGGLTYDWSTGSDTSFIANVVANQYLVTVTDAKGCSIMGTYVVLNQAGPTISITNVNHVSCFGTNTGSATVSATGGTLPYTILWSDGQTTPIAAGLVDGVYNVAVTDSNGCMQSQSVTINEPALLGFFLSTSNPLCYNATNGFASVNVYGGTTPYTYTWTGTGTPNGNSFTNLGNGSFSILVTDSLGCTYMEPFSLTQPTQVIMAVIGVDALCPNSNDGIVYIDTIYGGTPPYTYIWNNGQLLPIAYDLGPGTYCVTASDANLCTQSACGVVTTPSSLNLDSLATHEPGCFGTATGSITAYISGGSPAYDFVWNFNGNYYANTSSISGLVAGTYSLTVTDLNSCTITSSVLIGQPPPLVVNVDSTSVLCNGLCDGVLVADVTGGQPPYSYTWSTFGLNQTEGNLCDGTYTVTVEDDHGCLAIKSGVVGEPPLLVITNIVVTDAACGVADGSATVYHNGGTVGFEIDWGFPGGNSFTENNLSAGSYYVTVSDMYDCEASAWVIVNNLGGPTINSVTTTPVTCAGFDNGTALINYNESSPPADPYLIIWENSLAQQVGIGDQAFNLPGGTYSVQIEDTNHCVNSYSFLISQPAPLQCLINNSQDVDCFGECNGWAFVSSQGGNGSYSYLWSNGDVGQQAQSLCMGAYSVIVTDLLGCFTSASVFIDQPAQITMSANVVDVTCFGFNNGSITINAGGGSGTYNYAWLQVGWAGNNNSASQLDVGNYTVVVYDQQTPLCYIDSIFTIEEPDPIEVFVSTTPTTCDLANGTAHIDNTIGGSGLYNYVWSPSNTVPTATGLNYSTTYLLQVFDQAANSCYITEYVNVQRLAPPTINTQWASDPSCHDMGDAYGFVGVKDGSIPYYYEWFNVATNSFVYGGTDSLVSGLQAGLYTVEITDADQCTVTTSILINNPAPVTIYGYGSQTICDGQFAIISASAGGGTFPYTYSWNQNITNNNQVQVVYPLATTSYMVTATDFNGCVSGPTVIPVIVRPPLEVTLFANDTLICQYDSIRLQAFATGGNGDYDFYWSDGTTSFETTVMPYFSTTYSVTVYDAEYCSAPDDDFQNITVMPAPPLDMLADITQGCEPLFVQFYNTPSQTGVVYDWVFGDASSAGSNTSQMQNPQHTYESSGSYDVSLTITDVVYGCKSSYTFDEMVNVWANPIADFHADPFVTSLFHSEVQFSDLSTNASYWYWDFGDSYTSFIQHPEHAYQYADTFLVRLEVHSPENCIDVIIKPVLIRPETTFYAPTAFSPKPGQVSDQNAYFTPEGTGISDCTGGECYKLYIYDRWGELIFYTDEFYGNTGSENDRWNGRVNNEGKIVQVGVYSWYCEYVDINGEPRFALGPVTVIR